MGGYEKIGQEYSRETKREYWDMAIGLKAVDNLQPSDYLKELSEKNISGEISNPEIERLIYRHYETEAVDKEDRTRESDLVSNRIVELLQMDAFTLSISTLKGIHRYLFRDLLEDAGNFRTYNISKKEMVLHGETVKYANYFMIEETLQYDLEQEKRHRYSRESEEETVAHLAKFTADIWQVHPFPEGNTRTTAVFIERYLNTVGFQVDNTLFAEHAKYFRNALVRANYANYREKIDVDMGFLGRFFENLLMGGNNLLRNRDMILGEKEKKRRPSGR